MNDLSKWLWPDFDSTTIIIISVALVFCLFILLTRIAGLRTFAKMTSFDFATTIAVGSILATISLDTSTSVGNGLVALIAIIGFQIWFAFLQRKSHLFRKTATNEPVVLMRDGVIDYKALSKSNLHKSELMAKLREANVLRFTEVKAVVFESTGDISVLHTSDSSIEIEDEILDFLN